MDVEKCVPREHFFYILKHNELETLVGQLLSLMFVAADRCIEVDSPKAQLSVRNGLSLVDHMFVLYNEWITIHHQVPQAPLSQSFLKQLIRMLLTTADEKVFNVHVLMASNQCFAHILNIPNFAPQVLSYIFDVNNVNTVRAVFLNCLPRLLLYEGSELFWPLLPDAYSIMWSLCSFNNHVNEVQRMLAQRDDVPKLRNLMDLLITHAARLSTQSEHDVQYASLRFLVNMCLYNPHFRSLFASSDKFSYIWVFLLGLICQNLNRKVDEGVEDVESIISTTSLVVKLLYIMCNNDEFLTRIINVTIEKQQLDFFERTFSVTDKEEAVNTGRLYSLSSWLNVVLFNCVRRRVKKNDEEEQQRTTLAFVDWDVASGCLRILYILSTKHPEKLLSDCAKVQQFFENLIYSLLSVIATMVVLAEQSDSVLAYRFFENSSIIMHLFSFFMTVPDLTDNQMERFHKMLMRHKRVLRHAKKLGQRLQGNNPNERSQTVIGNFDHIINYLDQFSSTTIESSLKESTTKKDNSKESK